MTSRERVLAALSHRQPDKVAIDIGATCCSTMHVNCFERLRTYYGLPHKPVEVWDVSSMTGVMTDDLAQALRIDTAAARTRGTSFGLPRDSFKLWQTNMGQEVLVPSSFQPVSDGAGGWYVYPQGDTSLPPSGHMPEASYYFDNIVRGEPVKDVQSLNPDEQIEEFQLFTDKDIAYIKRDVEKAYATGRAVVFSMPGLGLGDISEIPGPGLKHPKGIRTIEDWYVAPLLYPDYVMEVFDRQTDRAIKNLETLNALCGDQIDLLYACGTDFGHQTGQFLSVDTFREIYLPFYQKVNGWVHKNTKWKIIKHSCGAVAPLIPSFIDAGFDALNPVQCSAQGMEPERLKREFGADITFWGGGVDTQKVLPFGTPDEIRRQVLERLDIFSKDGGYVFDAIHVIQGNVPTENIVAMIDAVHEFNGDR